MYLSGCSLYFWNQRFFSTWRKNQACFVVPRREKEPPETSPTGRLDTYNKGQLKLEHSVSQQDVSREFSNLVDERIAKIIEIIDQKVAVPPQGSSRGRIVISKSQEKRCHVFDSLSFLVRCSKYKDDFFPVSLLVRKSGGVRLLKRDG